MLVSAPSTHLLRPSLSGSDFHIRIPKYICQLSLSDSRSLGKFFNLSVAVSPMAANSSELALPMLPTDLLIMIAHSLQWTEDFDDLVFLWTKLRSVSQLLKETVEGIFAARDISTPAKVLKLLSTATITIFQFSMFLLYFPE